MEVVWLVSLFLFHLLEEWSTFGKPFECHCEGGFVVREKHRGNTPTGLNFSGTSLILG